MIELFFIACLQTAPTACEERSIGYIENVSMMECLAQAQPQLAAWTEAHPNLRVARWSCRFADQKPQEA
ncbi:MAG: hypothetical protein H0T41_12200 [Rhodobacteraceae bacterium]|nr:hypothetical protein [Paracoccaceae bacterium]